MAAIPKARPDRRTRVCRGGWDAIRYDVPIPISVAQSWGIRPGTLLNQVSNQSPRRIPTTGRASTRASGSAEGIHRITTAECHAHRNRRRDELGSRSTGTTTPLRVARGPEFDRFRVMTQGLAVTIRAVFHQSGAQKIIWEFDFQAPDRLSNWRDLSLRLPVLSDSPPLRA